MAFKSPGSENIWTSLFNELLKPMGFRRIRKINGRIKNRRKIPTASDFLSDTIFSINNRIIRRGIVIDKVIDK